MWFFLHFCKELLRLLARLQGGKIRCNRRLRLAVWVPLKRPNFSGTNGKNQQEIFISSPIASKEPSPKSLKRAIPKQMRLQWNLRHWDVVEHAATWTKPQPGQTNSCLARRREGGEGEWGAPPFSPLCPPDPPTPLCHFTSDLIHSLHLSFMLTLTSFGLCHPSWGRRCSITADTKTLKYWHHFPFFF